MIIKRKPAKRLFASALLVTSIGAGWALAAQDVLGREPARETDVSPEVQESGSVEVHFFPPTRCPAYEASDGYAVTPYFANGYGNPAITPAWVDAALERHLPHDFAVGTRWKATIAAVFAMSNTTIRLVFAGGEYRNSEGELLAGFACGNVALVFPDHTGCPDDTAAHEVGHVLGLGHDERGFMAARVQCRSNP